MIYLLLYAAWCIVFAKINAILIADKKKIYHGLNAFIHLIAAGVGYWIEGWQIGVAVLCVARLFFDVALNLFRGKAIDYISSEVMKYRSIKEALKKGKTIDYIEYKLFNKDGITPKLVYLTIAVVLLAVKYI